ncbi:MAG TPA: pyridoxamine 5'-phosphate oxidase family protein [Alphaproteobacteria bacterium]|nr:pyridoxamine 5'-phosphate oxidase family protein [Alphaproteobacteria bacterium]
MTTSRTAELKTGEEVRAHYDAPHEVALRKEMTRLDRHCRAFIAAAPFVVIATADAQGRADASPRGDAPGFVAVRDETTILIPDRRGNNRVDTMMNIAENPHVGLLFMVPGMNETLRVNGRALITIDRQLLAPLAAQGKTPQAAIMVTVEEVYFQCGKALVRADLWNPDRRIARRSLPSLGRILADEINLSYGPELEKAIEDDYRTGLY